MFQISFLQPISIFLFFPHNNVLPIVINLFPLLKLLCDLVRKEKGISAQRYIQNKLIAISKERLITENLTINEIAYGLGLNILNTLIVCLKEKWAVRQENSFNTIN